MMSVLQAVLSAPLFFQAKKAKHRDFDFDHKLRQKLYLTKKILRIDILEVSLLITPRKTITDDKCDDYCSDVQYEANGHDLCFYVWLACVKICALSKSQIGRIV